MRVFAIIGGLVLTVLIAALVAPWFINWSDYKEAFEREAQKLTGLPVNVAGEARVRILPFPSLSFSDVRIGPDEQPIIVAEQFAMDAELAPFLSGELRIIDMRLERPFVNLMLDEDGALLVDRDTGPRQALDVLQDISLERALVNDATITIRQQLADRTRRWRATGVEGQLAIDSVEGPIRFDGDMVLEGVPAKVIVSTGLLGGEGLAVNTRTTWPNRGVEIATQGRIEVPVDAGPDARYVYDGVFQIDPVDDEGIDFFVEGVFTADGSGLLIDQYRASFGGGPEPYTVEGDFSLRDQAGRPDYSLTARGVQVNLDGADDEAAAGETVALATWVDLGQNLFSRLPLPTVPGSIRIDLPAIVSGDTVVRDIRLVAQPGDRLVDGSETWRFTQINAVFPGRTTLEGSGEIIMPPPDGTVSELEFRGPLVVASRQPSGLAAWLGFGNPESIRALRQAGFEGSVRATASEWNIDDLEIILDTDRVAGNVSILPANKPKPLVSVSVEGSNVSEQTMAVFQTAFAAPDGANLPIGADLALDFTSPTIEGVTLARLDADLRIRDDVTSIDRLLLQDFAGADIAATATITDLGEGAQTGFDVSVVSADASQVLTQIPSLLAGSGAGFDQVLMGQIADHFDRVASDGPAALSDANLSLKGTHSNQADGWSASALISGTIGQTDLVGNLDLSKGAQLRGNATMRNPSGVMLASQLGVWLPPETAGTGEVTVLVQPDADTGMATTVNARLGDVRLDLDGRLTRSIALFGPQWGFAGSVATSGPDVDTVWSVLQLPWAGQSTNVQPFDAEAQLAWQQGNPVSLDLTSASLGQQAIGGTLGIDNHDGLLDITGDLVVERFDADAMLLAFAGLEASTALTDTFSANIAALPDINVSVSADSFTAAANGIALTDFTGRLTHDGAKLAFGPFEALASGSTIAGNLVLQNLAGEVAATARLAIDDINIDTLLADVPEIIDASPSVSASIAGSGRSIAAVVGSLSGSGVVTTGPLAVDGLGADRFAPFVAAVDSFGIGITPEQTEDSVAGQLLTGASQYGSVETPLVIAGGKAQLSNLVLTEVTGAIQLTVDGDVSFLDGTTAADIAVRHDVSSMEGLTLPPVFFVRWENGTASIDTSAMEAFVTQRAIEREQQRIDALQARLLERQRFRRSVRIARYERDQRLAREQAERGALEEEARRQREAEAAQARADAQRRQQQAQERQQSTTAPAPTGQEVQRQALPPISPGATSAPGGGSIFQDLDFDN